VCRLPRFDRPLAWSGIISFRGDPSACTEQFALVVK
jgi:hypothetical protein